MESLTSLALLVGFLELIMGSCNRFFKAFSAISGGTEWAQRCRGLLL